MKRSFGCNGGTQSVARVLSRRRWETVVRTGILTAVLSLGGPALKSQAMDGDDFNDNTRDATKWGGIDYLTGNGVLAETNQRLEYVVSSPDLVAGDEAARPWVLQQPRTDNDFEVILEVVNSTTPPSLDRVASFGFEIFNASNLDEYVYVELYASRLDFPALRRGFKADVAINGEELLAHSSLGDSGDLKVTSGSVRLLFNARSKVFSTFYDFGKTNRYVWHPFASFGIAGQNGATTNLNWNLAGGAEFQIALYGFSQGMVVAGGTLFGDNFFLQTASVEAPELLVSRQGNEVEIQWPKSAFNYQLETIETVTPGPWTLVDALPEVKEEVISVRLPIDRVEQFFRLRR